MGKGFIEGRFTGHCGACESEADFGWGDMKGALVNAKAAGWWEHHTYGWICKTCTDKLDGMARPPAHPTDDR